MIRPITVPSKPMRTTCVANHSTSDQRRRKTHTTPNAAMPTISQQRKPLSPSNGLLAMPAIHRPTSPAAPIAWRTTQRDRKASGAVRPDGGATDRANAPSSTRDVSRAWLPRERNRDLIAATSGCRSAPSPS